MFETRRRNSNLFIHTDRPILASDHEMKNVFLTLTGATSDGDSDWNVGRGDNLINGIYAKQD